MKNVSQTIKNAAYKTAKKTLATGHLVADTIADGFIHLEMKLDKDVDPQQISDHRMETSMRVRQDIINKSKGLFRKAKKATEDIMRAPSPEEYAESIMVESVILNKTN